MSDQLVRGGPRVRRRGGRGGGGGAGQGIGMGVSMSWHCRAAAALIDRRWSVERTHALRDIEAGIVFWFSGGPWDASGTTSGGPEPPDPTVWPLQQETRISNHQIKTSLYRSEKSKRI